MRFIFLLLLIVGVSAHSERFSASWDEVNQWTNGEPIEPEDMIGYRVYAENGTVTKQSEYTAVMPDDTTAQIVLTLPPGVYTYQFAVTALAWKDIFIVGGSQAPVRTPRESELSDVVTLEFAVNADDDAVPMRVRGVEIIIIPASALDP